MLLKEIAHSRTGDKGNISVISVIAYKDEDQLLQNAQNVDEVYINEVLPGKMAWNLKSIKEFSFLQDIKTMVDTVLAVLR